MLQAADCWCQSGNGLASTWVERQGPWLRAFLLSGLSQSLLGFFSFPQHHTWVFESKELMFKSSAAVPEGSLVYVSDGNSAFIRTPKGWSKLLVLYLPTRKCQTPAGHGRAFWIVSNN